MPFTLQLKNDNTAMQQSDLEQVLDEAQLIGGHNHTFAIAHGSHWKLPLRLCIPLQRIHTTLLQSQHHDECRFAGRGYKSLTIQHRLATTDWNRCLTGHPCAQLRACAKEGLY